MSEDEIEAITKIATYMLQKEHPEQIIRDWQTRYVLMAYYEYEKALKEDDETR